LTLSTRLKAGDRVLPPGGDTVKIKKTVKAKAKAKKPTKKPKPKKRPTMDKY
jgi:hypothetical protein